MRHREKETDMKTPSNSTEVKIGIKTKATSKPSKLANCVPFINAYPYEMAKMQPW